MNREDQQGPEQDHYADDNTTYKVQYINKNGDLGRKSIVHRNRLNSARTQAHCDEFAEVQLTQEAHLAALPGGGDESEVG